MGPVQGPIFFAQLLVNCRAKEELDVVDSPLD